MKIYKIGLFGGTFNPIHRGHKNSVEQVIATLDLDKMIVMPAHQSPHRSFDDSVLPEHRLEMVRLTFKDLKDVEVSGLEMERGGISYTIDTVNEVLKNEANSELYLIIGPDQLINFHSWKNYQDILSKCNLVVTSRPGFDANPGIVEAITPVIEKKIDMPDPNIQAWNLTSGKSLFLIELEDVDVSSTEIRLKLRSGENVRELITDSVLDYIDNKKLYPKISDILEDVEILTQFCAKVLDDGKAINVVAKDLRGEDRPMEYALIASGTSRKHALSLAENLARKVKKEFRLNPINIDGQIESQWIVLDYGPLLVNVFYDFTRQEYKLEELWAKSKDLKLDI